MEGKEVLTDAYGRIQGTLRRAVNGLTLEQLCYRPNEDANSIAWLAWHLTRVQDDHISSLMGRPQAWVDQGWHAKFNMPPDSHDIGTGHTSEQVAALRPPDAETLLAYHNAVFERTKEYLETLNPGDLDRELNEPQYQPLPTVGVRLVSVISDNTQHAGQAAYLRGIIQGRGWQSV